MAPPPAGEPTPALSAGLGIVVFGTGADAGWFKGAHDDGTANMAVCLAHGRRCVVMMANDVRAERIFASVGLLALGPTAMPWAWEYAWLAPAAAPPPWR